MSTSKTGNNPGEQQSTSSIPAVVSTIGSGISSLSSFSRRPGRGFYRGGGRGRRGRSRGGRSNNRWLKNDTSSKKFKGETSELNHNVFQTPVENPPVTQFKDSIQALERYAFKTYTGIDWQVLFADFELPELEMPKDIDEKSASRVEKRN